MIAQNFASADGRMIAWSAVELQDRRAAWQRKGLTICATELAALNRAARALLMPAAEVSRLRPNEDTDAFKVF